MQGDEMVLHSSTHRSKVLKVLQGKNFYYNKIIRGDEDYLMHLKYFMEQRKDGFILKRKHFRNEDIQQQMANNQRFINFRSEWVHCTSILNHLNSSFTNSRFLKMDSLIEQFLVQLIIGPNQFFYQYSNALFGTNQEHLFINYQSTLGFQLANQAPTICKCQLNEYIPLLAHSNFKKGQFTGLTIQNKFRAIAMFIITLLKNQVKITPNHQQVPLKNVSSEITQSLKNLKKIVNQEAFYQQVGQFQAETQKDYYYYLSELLCQNKTLSWQEVIDLLIMPYESHPQDHYQSFNKIVGKTARMLYSSEPAFIKEKFKKSGIVQAGQDPDCELYLKVKLSQSSQDLLFLLKFKRLSDLLDFKGEDNQQQKERILKLFFSLLIEVKKRQETTSTNPEEQSYVFNKQQLRFISTFSNTYGISKGKRYNQTIHIVSPHSDILHRFLTL